VLFVIADLSKISIEHIKRGNIFHLSIDSIICYCQMIINKMNKILAFYISLLFLYVTAKLKHQLFVSKKVKAKFQGTSIFSRNVLIWVMIIKIFL
jgi:hypothetical protein